MGYGEQEQGNVTGVVNKVSSEDFNKAPTVSADRLLQGKVAGLNIKSNSGRPGGKRLSGSEAERRSMLVTVLSSWSTECL